MKKSKYVIITEWYDNEYIIEEFLEDAEFREELCLIKAMEDIKNIACYRLLNDRVSYELIYKRKNGIESWYGKNE